MRINVPAISITGHLGSGEDNPVYRARKLLGSSRFPEYAAVSQWRGGQSFARHGGWTVRAGVEAMIVDYDNEKAGDDQSIGFFVDDSPMLISFSMAQDS